MDRTTLEERLGTVVGQALGRNVTVEEFTRLPGGASKNTWSFTVRGTDGFAARLILRAERPGTAGNGMAIEASVLRAAADRAVPVPRIVVDGSESDALDGRFLVTEFVDGETIARRILRDDNLAEARRTMAAQCGRILADLHRIAPDEVTGLSDGDVLEQARAHLDALGQSHPALELGLRWLSEHRPERTRTTVVHGDFRNGNFIVGPDGVRAVLDWELAHLGDPVEDLGWLCVKAWRFGATLPVGGFGTVEDLVSGYEAAGGEPVDRNALRWWVVYGTLHWGIVCIAQALTHLRGVVRSVELAAIGRRVCEVESDLLDLLPWRAAPAPAAAGGDPAPPAGGPHDVPTAAELLEAVQGYLEGDVMPATEGRVRFHARVAANVVAMVAREIALGPAQAVAHRRRLAALGLASEEELAEAIRAGTLDRRLDEVADVVRATVADKLEVANPAYRTGDDLDLKL
ncbi:MAG TPA: phosphotransferase family protein [Acidimicrobiales bacterium]|nr:phosphotransferase family protein [Acidimicrobiales bacterium]